MNSLEGLKAEINDRLLASHPSIILEALESLLQEVAGAHVAMRSGECTYSVNFRLYSGLHSRVSFLRRRLDYPWIYAADGNLGMSAISRSLDTVDSNLRTLRMKRYENVCKVCKACLTRRKRWPEHAKFLRIPATSQLEAFA